MPLIKHSTYRAPIFMKNAHLQTIYPSLFRKCDKEIYQRKRIFTNDDDFLDLDWSKIGSDNLVIISHGLEGNSTRAYVLGMVNTLNQNGWDALAWNFRSCSGEINRQLRFYHSGSINDLELVIQHALKLNMYQKIALVGFSMGGNLTLVYLGKKGNQVSKQIVKSVVFSVPCDLQSSSYELAKLKNKIYMKRFLNLLHQKIKSKMEFMPDQINNSDYNSIKNFKQYDDRYTAPIHGFKNAEDYWDKCSSKQFIPKIQTPTLIVNAKNDPFLGDKCYPIEEADKSKYVYLETPKEGGHVSFLSFNEDKSYWSEQRVVEFLGES